MELYTCVTKRGDDVGCPFVFVFIGYWLLNEAVLANGLAE